MKKHDIQLTTDELFIVRLLILKALMTKTDTTEKKIMKNIKNKIDKIAIF